MALDGANVDSNIYALVERIRQEMSLKGLNQQDLSKALIDKFGKKKGLSKGGVSLLFRGRIKFKHHHARMIAVVLNLEEEELCSLLPSPMKTDKDTLEALKDTARFFFKKANGDIGSMPVPQVDGDHLAKIEAYAEMYRKLEEKGFDML